MLTWCAGVLTFCLHHLHLSGSPGFPLQSGSRLCRFSYTPWYSCSACWETRWSSRCWLGTRGWEPWPTFSSSPWLSATSCSVSSACHSTSSPTCSRILSSGALSARPPPTSWVSCCCCLFLEFYPKSVKLSPRPSLTPESLHREALMGVQSRTSDCMGLRTRTEELPPWGGPSSKRPRSHSPVRGSVPQSGVTWSETTEDTGFACFC